MQFWTIPLFLLLATACHQVAGQGCPVVTRISQQITVSDSILSDAVTKATRLHGLFQDLAAVYTATNPIEDFSASFSESPRLPTNVHKEVISSGIAEIAVSILNEVFNVQPNTSVIYSASALPGCQSSISRINADSPSQNCNFTDAYKFYQVDGSCLSSDLPGAGLANRAMSRIARPFCNLDGGNSLCKLPPAREVSLAIGRVLDGFPASPSTLVPNNLVLACFQFLIHETSQGQVAGNVNGSSTVAACGSDRRKIPSFLRDPYGDSMEVSCDDPFYKTFNVQCLNFQRNRKMNERCDAQIPSFLNSAPPCMDLNTIYYILNAQTGRFESLQSTGGQLRKDSKGRHVLPYKNNEQHSVLTAVSLLFSRFHDACALELKAFRPSLSDDFIFQTCKRINIGCYQHMWYTDLLVLFIGSNDVTNTTVKNTFDPTVVPQIIMEFAAAAGRLSHILVPDNITMASEWVAQRVIALRDTFGNTELAFANFSQIVAGAVMQPWRTASVSKEIQNHMFTDKAKGYGEDLFATDQQRERDACLEPYINYLRSLVGICVRDWPDLLQVMSQKAIDELKKLYKSVKDIELYVGCVLEDSFGNSLFGPTANAITSAQFFFLKAGDKKFYSNMPANQRNEIAKMRFNHFLAIAASMNTCLRDMRFNRTPCNTVVNCTVTRIRDLIDFNVFM